MSETSRPRAVPVWKKTLVLVAASVLLGALGFGFGYQVIAINEQKSMLGWVEPEAGSAGPGGLQAGLSTLRELQDRFGPGEASLVQSDNGRNLLEVRYARLIFGSDRVLLRALLELSPAQLTALLLAGEAGATGAGLPPAALDTVDLHLARILELQIEPEEPLDHERVLYSYGRPKLTMGLPADGAGSGDTAWLYPRKGLAVFFADERAIRFQLRAVTMAGTV